MNGSYSVCGVKNKQGQLYGRWISVRRTAYLFMIIVICVAMVACGKSSENDKTNAEYYINGLKEKGLPVGTVVVYNSENDPSGQLGTPNQYISKANFEDTRVGQITDENGEIMKDEFGNPDVLGGTVEVFASKEDITARKEFMESAYENMGEKVGQYMFINGNAMLRVEFSLTPEQAKEYGKAFAEL